MNIPLVKKIRKPILVMSVVVAMASLLFTFGDTTHQAQAATKDTTHQVQTTSLISFDDAMSIIDDQRNQSYQALQTMDSLYQNGRFQGCSVDYYGNGRNYYNTSVASQFNQWLNNLAGEIQNGDPILNNSDDQILITNALQANYAFTTWVGQVASYFSTNSCLQGQGDYLLAPFSKAILPGGEIIPEPEIVPSWREGIGNALKITYNGFNFISSAITFQQFLANHQWNQSQPTQQPQPTQQSQQSCFLGLFC